MSWAFQYALASTGSLYEIELFSSWPPVPAQIRHELPTQRCIDHIQGKRAGRELPWDAQTQPLGDQPVTVNSLSSEIAPSEATLTSR